MVEKISMDEIKKELSILRNYETLKNSDNNGNLPEITNLYKKYCESMHSAGIIIYLKFYLLFICNASRNYIVIYFGWSENSINQMEKAIYNHLYKVFNEKQV